VTLRFTDPQSAPHNLNALGDTATTTGTDWLAALKTRSGPLMPAARSFIRTHCPALEGSSPSSATLLRELARCMQRFLTIEVVEEEAERAFVEGAGALLGMILIVHVGDASHAVRGQQHRVRLRKYGFFDPFLAIDRALDAEHVRKGLAQEVVLAEAEAQGTGPTARIVRGLAMALERRGSDFVICDQFEGYVVLQSTLDGSKIELDLQRGIDTTRDQSEEAAERVVQRYLSMLPGAPSLGEGAHSLRSRLLPRIVRSDVIADLSMSGQSVLFSLAWVGELAIAVVVQEPGRARYLRQSELADLELDAPSLVALARSNLEACAGEMRLVPSREIAGAFVARTGDGRDSARLLLPLMYERLRDKLGPLLCIGLPHRDTFFVCSAEDNQAVHGISTRTAEDAARAPHRLCSHLFLLGPAGLTVLRR